MKVYARTFITGHTYNEITKKAVQGRKLILRLRYCSLFSFISIITSQVSHINCHILFFSWTNIVYYDVSINFYDIHIKHLTNYNNMENTTYSNTEKIRKHSNTQHKELEPLIIASIETLKRQKIKCEIDEVL